MEPRRPPIEEMITTEPLPRSAICGIASARTKETASIRLTPVPASRSISAIFALATTVMIGVLLSPGPAFGIITVIVGGGGGLLSTLFGGMGRPILVIFPDALDRFLAKRPA